MLPPQIFVVDSNDRDRAGEAHDELHRMLGEVWNKLCTGLAQIVGQVQGSGRDSQSKSWAKYLVQPCETHLTRLRDAGRLLVPIICPPAPGSTLVTTWIRQGIYIILLRQDELRDAVLLVFANKQDLPNAMSVAEVTPHPFSYGPPPPASVSYEKCPPPPLPRFPMDGTLSLPFSYGKPPPHPPPCGPPALYSARKTAATGRCCPWRIPRVSSTCGIAA
jgi:hypothetical protein